MQRTKLSIIWGIATSVALAPALPGQADPPRKPVARIGEQPIYEEDLLPSIGGPLQQLRNQEYELKIKAIETLVNRRLLEEEARSKGLSADAFLEQTVDRNLPPPSAGEIQTYYLAQKDQFNRPLNDVRPQVEQALLRAKRQQAQQDYLEQLRKRAGFTILLSRPRVEVSADPARLRGNPDAPVTIVEFADFQCPYCQAVEKTLKEVLDKYQGKVSLTFRDYPLSQIHAQAAQAAEASRCAGEQGKFWEYHDLLFANQGRLDPAALAEHARSAGLETERFTACLASRKFKAQVESDLRAGTVAGVSGTPAFYINGLPLAGSQPASAFEAIIDSELPDTRPGERAP